METIVSENNIHITDSYTIKCRKTMVTLLQNIKYEHPECKVFSRSGTSLVHEGVTHNRLYKFGLGKDRTKDVDLNVPIKGYMEVLYFILGI